MEGISLSDFAFFLIVINYIKQQTRQVLKSVGFVINYILINDSNFPIPLDHVYA